MLHELVARIAHRISEIQTLRSGVVIDGVSSKVAEVIPMARVVITPLVNRP